MTAVLRRLARDQWIRLHGTPRVTVLVGGSEAMELWRQWLRVAGREGTLLRGNLDDIIRDAVGRALEAPLDPIAITTPKAELEHWRLGRQDRLASLVDEGWPEVPVDARYSFDARSAAEATLFEALETTPSTAGRFRLNEYLSVRFGNTAAQVDLLSREDRIAIEIDGYHHFTDPECFRRDRRKDLLLQTQGLLVIRVLAEDVMRDPRDAVTMVCQALAHRTGGPT